MHAEGALEGFDVPFVLLALGLVAWHDYQNTRQCFSQLFFFAFLSKASSTVFNSYCLISLQFHCKLTASHVVLANIEGRDLNLRLLIIKAGLWHITSAFYSAWKEGEASSLKYLVINVSILRLRLHLSRTLLHSLSSSAVQPAAGSRMAQPHQPGPSASVIPVLCCRCGKSCDFHVQEQLWETVHGCVPCMGGSPWSWIAFEWFCDWFFLWPFP